MQQEIVWHVIRYCSLRKNDLSSEEATLCRKHPAIAVDVANCRLFAIILVLYPFQGKIMNPRQFGTKSAAAFAPNALDRHSSIARLRSSMLAYK